MVKINNKYELSEERLEELRQAAIKNGMEKFGWTKERAESVLGKNYIEFLNKVELVKRC